MFANEQCLLDTFASLKLYFPQALHVLTSQFFCLGVEVMLESPDNTQVPSLVKNPNTPCFVRLTSAQFFEDKFFRTKLIFVKVLLGTGVPGVLFSATQTSR